MLYMIEVHFKEQHRAAALEYFWQHGSTHYEGKVSVQGLWVASQDHIAYALVQSQDQGEVEKACAPLQEFGQVFARSVTSSDEL